MNTYSDVVDCSIRIFADDTKIYLPIQSYQDHKKIQIILMLCWSGATDGSYASIGINVKYCTLEIITLNMIMS